MYVLQTGNNCQTTFDNLEDNLVLKKIYISKSIQLFVAKGSVSILVIFLRQTSNSVVENFGNLLYNLRSLEAIANYWMKMTHYLHI